MKLPYFALRNISTKHAVRAARGPRDGPPRSTRSPRSPRPTANLPKTQQYQGKSITLYTENLTCCLPDVHETGQGHLAGLSVHLTGLRPSPTSRAVVTSGVGAPVGQDDP